jgi:hypothetical protein
MRISSLYGELPALRDPLRVAAACGGGAAGSALPPPGAAAFVVARLVAGGEELGLETKTTYAEAGTCGCSWGEQLTLCLKVGLGVPGLASAQRGAAAAHEPSSFPAVGAGPHRSGCRARQGPAQLGSCQRPPNPLPDARRPPSLPSAAPR